MNRWANLSQTYAASHQADVPIDRRHCIVLASEDDSAAFVRDIAGGGPADHGRAQIRSSLDKPH
jgi:hypothetical protein